MSGWNQSKETDGEEMKSPDETSEVPHDWNGENPTPIHRYQRKMGIGGWPPNKSDMISSIGIGDWATLSAVAEEDGEAFP